MSLLHAENDIEDMTDMHDSGRDREISLGTSTLIGVFFALALVCSAFFGFGYSLGRKSAQTVGRPVVDTGASASTGGGLFRSFKPAPGNPAKGGPGTVSAASVPDADSTSGSSGSSNSVVVPVTKAEAAPPVRKTFDPDAQVVGDPAGPVATPKAAPIVRQTPAVASVAPAIVPGGTALVQVAAVSHQEDADTLVTMLRRKGYNVQIRSEAQDKLLHVQLGPYATKKDAEAMQKRLEADGYHSIVK